MHFELSVKHKTLMSESPWLTQIHTCLCVSVCVCVCAGGMLRDSVLTQRRSRGEQRGGAGRLRTLSECCVSAATQEHRQHSHASQHRDRDRERDREMERDRGDRQTHEGRPVIKEEERWRQRKKPHWERHKEQNQHTWIGAVTTAFTSQAHTVLDC